MSEIEIENELEAEQVYVLMKKDCRISRNIRAEWFFKKINTTIQLQKIINLNECEDELEIVSVVPRNPPPDWDVEVSQFYKYRITASTVVTFLSWKYHLVFCLDLGPSIAVVDVQDGEVMFDQVIMALGKCLDGVTCSFRIPGSHHEFQPQLYVTVVIHVPSKAVTNHVLAQGWLVTRSGLSTFLEHVQSQLLEIEDVLAQMEQLAYDRKLNSSKDDFPSPNSEIDSQSNVTSLRLIPDMNFVSLVQHGILSLQLIPENITTGVIVVTNGIIGMPDITATEALLNQLRRCAISCSFLQVGTSYHPNCSFGFVPYLDLMQFIATATQGTYFAKTPDSGSCGREMNSYHKAFYAWKFQYRGVNEPSDFLMETPNSSEWSTTNRYFYARKDVSLYRKRYHGSKMATTLSALLSCRLREGYVIKDVAFKDNNHLQISLVLLWKHNVNLEYVISSIWPPGASGQNWLYEIIIEGSYEFLHDFVYVNKKYRNLDNRTIVIKQFRCLLQGLIQTDKLLTHLHSFASTQGNYTIPESIKKKMPLFTGSSNTSGPIPYTSDCTHPTFTQFWKPICNLDTSIWQKWMHTHRLNVILEHEHPLPKHLHLPAPSGRYQNVQCRQAMAALQSLLTEWSSFVLVENHSYIKFLYSDLEKPPTNFYIIRISSKPPCIVIRLAFLGGTSGDVRNKVIRKLRDKVLSLTFPQRPVVKDTLVRKGLVSYVVDRANDQKQRPPAHINCCILFNKPLDKILIRYEKVPVDYFMLNPVSLPSNLPPMSPMGYPKLSISNGISSLEHYLYHRRWIWAAQGPNVTSVSLAAIGRILNALVKIRLNEGFTIAYSHYGMVNLVMEVEMKNPVEHVNSMHEDEPHFSVIQYVLFPHHTTYSPKENFFSDDEIDLEIDTSENDGELHVISECWVEPQDGVVKNVKGLEGCNYKEIVQSFFPRDHECISTIITFEHLSLLCQIEEPLKSSSFLHSPTNFSRCTDDTIQYVPLSIDINQFLPKCHQTELHFSTYIQKDPHHSDSSDAPNELLVELLIDHLSEINDREVHLTAKDNHMFPFQVRERDNSVGSDPTLVNKHNDYDGLRLRKISVSDTAGVIPKWRCFVKALSPTHVFLTFTPASFSDIKLLAVDDRGPFSKLGISKIKYLQDEYVTEEIENPELIPTDADRISTLSPKSKLNVQDSGSIILPVFVYDCSLSILIDQLVNKENSERPRDQCVDLTYKLKTELGEDTVTLRSDTHSSEESKHTSPEPRSEESYTPGNNIELQQHCNNIESVFSKCFVLGVFRSLHVNHHIHALDIQSVVDGICTESLLEIDITNFLQTVCGHVRGFKVKTALEQLRWTGQHSLSVSDTDHQTYGGERPVTVRIGDDHVVLNPKFPVVSLEHNTCELMHELHQHIKHKFSTVFRKSFLPVPSNKDYFFYCLPSFQQSRTKSEFLHDKESTSSQGSNEYDVNAFKSDLRFERGFMGYPYNRHSSVGGGDVVNDPDIGVTAEIASQMSIFSNVDSESVASIVGDVMDDNDEEDDTLPPLFIHLMCTLKVKTNVGSCSIRCLPTCLGEILQCLESPVTELDLSDLRITLDIICLTLQSDGEFFGKGMRTTSFCSVSPLPADGNGSYQGSPDDSYPGETTSDQLIHLPEFQHQAVTNCMEEIKWMLRDEIASAMLDFFPLTEKTLDMVASHVQSSPGRPGCVLEEVPLQFVFGSEQSLDKFILEFKQMALTGYHLSQEGEFYFLSMNRNITDKRSLDKQHQHHQNKFVVVQTTPHADDGTQLRLLGKPCVFDSSDDSRQLPENEFFDGKTEMMYQWKPSDDGRVVLDEVENESNLTFQPEMIKVLTDADVLSVSKDGNVNEKEEFDKINDDSQQKQQSMVHQRHASGQCSSTVGLSSDVSSLVGSGQCSNTEDGYDGDSSDVDNECDWMSDLDTQHPCLPKFWLILKVSTDKVHVYFHCRDTKENDVELQFCKDLYNQVIKNIKNICKIVNQTLLLQDLHDSRMCNQLLEPEASEDIWKFDDHLLSRSRLNMSMSKRPYEDSMIENNSEYNDSYLKANLDFMPGAFACNVVWQTHFILHSRLKTGPGRAGVSRGIQAMRGVLNSFSVNNRENMFVYAETSGAVFYLRLHESQCLVGNTMSFGVDSGGGSRSSSVSFKKVLEGEDDIPESRSRVNSLTETASVTRLSLGRQRMEDSIQLLVHGIAEAGPQIKEELVQVLQNRLDEAVLDVIAVTLSRNPKCKLTSEDVQFIQKPNEPPKAVLLFTVCAQAQPYLQAMNAYLKQNLQFLNAPNYIDNKAETHFQDYNPKSSETLPLKDGDAFLYNRSPASGNKGIALIALSVVDGPEGNPVQYFSCPRPTDHQESIHNSDFETLTSTSLYVPSKSTGKYPGPWSLIQLRIWERGKLDLEQLTTKLLSAVRHALWDVVMEYRLLTAPLSHSQLTEGPTYCSEPATPIKDKKASHAHENLMKKDRAPSPLTLVQVRLRELSSSVPDLIIKSRSPMASPKELPASAFKLSSSNIAHKEAEVNPDSRILRRQEQLEAIDKEKLLPVYAETMHEWIEFAVELKVPSVWKHTLTLTSRYSVDFVLTELHSLVTSLSSETTLKMYRETVIEGEKMFLPHAVSQSILKPRENRSDQSPDEPKKSAKYIPGKSNTFLLIGRDIKQWRASINYLLDEPFSEMTSLFNPTSHRSDLKYPPIIINNDHSDRMESSSCPATALVSGPTTTAPFPGTMSYGSLSTAIISPDTSSTLFIPRQRLLFIVVNDKQISMYGYNWSAESASKLQKQSTKLVQWNNTRAGLLNTVVGQKMGLFHETLSKKRKIKSDKDTMKATEMDLFKLTSPPNRDSSTPFTSRRQSASKSNLVVIDVLRDAQPLRPIHRTPYNHIRDPVLRHGHQVQDMCNAERKEQQKKLCHLLQNSPTHSNAFLNEESLQLLKQSSRVEHYCLTPLLFLPQWRCKVAGARDPTLTSLSQSAIMDSSFRLRHESECTTKSADRRGSITLPTLHNNFPIFIPSRSANDDIWHTPLCSTYIHEFTQYLQNLGFVPMQTRPAGKQRDGTEDTHVPIGLNLKTSSSNVQKSVIGGSLIIVELNIIEPYFSVRMYCLEGSRVHPDKAKNLQFAMTFVDECDRLKALIHLHSFTYDYHLRSIHSYISGRQLIFRQGYHLTSFLDDFVRYYQKSPNFAWNLISQDILVVKDTTTPANVLYDHLLTEKSYGMRVLRMIPFVMDSDIDVDNEYVLVQLTNRKVSYRDGNEMRRTDDFDISLLISQDKSPVTDRFTLVLKYNIILTSRRELYPRAIMDKKLGKFRTVAMVSPIASRKVSASSDRPDSDKLETPISQSLKTSSNELENQLVELEDSCEGESSYSSVIKSTDELHESVASDTESTSASVGMSSQLISGRTHSSIRQESVNYLGYFSTNEELMSQIMQEQIEMTKIHINAILQTAMINCRRDSLWKRLIVRDSDDRKRWRDDPREGAIYGLNYDEFKELLSLVVMQPMDTIDPQLTQLLNMHVTWYQGLAKVLINKYPETHRLFMEPEGTAQYVVIINPTSNRDVCMLLSVEPQFNRASLNVVYRISANFEHTPEKPNIHVQMVQTSIEDFVNTCCFHLWTCIM